MAVGVFRCPIEKRFMICFTQVEDGAVLGNLFSHISEPSQIPYFLRAYEQLRLKRTAAIQSSSRLNQKIFHLEDGEEQRRRDQAMREAMNGEEAKGNPNQWADRRKTKDLFGYDADEEAEKWWEERGRWEIETTRARL